MLISSLHGAVFWNTTKCPVTFYLVQTSIHNSVTRILAHTFGRNLVDILWSKLKVQAFFFCFSVYIAIQKGNQSAGENRSRMGAYRVMQTHYLYNIDNNDVILTPYMVQCIFIPFWYIWKEETHSYTMVSNKHSQAFIFQIQRGLHSYWLDVLQKRA